MSATHTELRAKLLAEAERSIDELPDWAVHTPRPNLTQIENAVLKMRRQLSEQAAQVVIEAHDTHRPVPGPLCPTCRREMHYKDTKARTVESRVGQLRIVRGYYSCEPCQQSLFPRSEELACSDQDFSHWAKGAWHGVGEVGARGCHMTMSGHAGEQGIGLAPGDAVGSG